ncbi:hypothetical protein L6452_19750 [Arctium lappa]|uniref:Uncharacterized protein n=1 Tax=Arctium lappa TaxID=4217 RepID=A0ACB9B9I4_ARCLA|nr:hypothetical protein L6452_19750 [Arctium lappa]
MPTNCLKKLPTETGFVFTNIFECWKSMIIDSWPLFLLFPLHSLMNILFSLHSLMNITVEPELELNLC